MMLLLLLNRYISHREQSEEKVFAMAGLSVPAGEWANTCPYEWCRKVAWPSGRGFIPLNSKREIDENSMIVVV